MQVTQYLKSSKWLSYVIVALAAVGMTVIWCFGCPVIDDYWYRNEYLGFIARGYSSFDACVQALIHRAMTDNVRLPNQLFVFLQPFDYRPFTGLFTGVCWWFSFVAALRTAGVGWRRPELTAMLAIMWLLGLPWEEYMLSAAFYLNYVFPTAAALGAIWLFVCRPNKWPAMVTCALVAAWGHESSGIALGAFLATYMMLKWRDITKFQWITFAVTVVFTLVHVLAPAYSARSNEYGLGHATFSFHEIFYYKSVLIYLLCAAVLLCVRGFIPYFKNVSPALVVSFGVVGMVAILFHFLLPGMDRPAWTALAGVYVGFVYLGSFIRIAKPLGAVFALITIIFLAWHFTATTIEVIKSRRLFFPALEAYIEAGCKPVFVPVEGEKDIIEASLGRASRLPFEPGVAAVNVSNYYDNGNLRSAVFVPLQLKDVDTCPGEKVPGDNDYYLKDGYLYRPYADGFGDEPFLYTIATVNRSGLKRRERFMLGQFATSDGRLWLYAVSTARLGCTRSITEIND